MRKHLVILLILVFAVAHSVTGIFTAFAAQPKNTLHSIEMLMADNTSMDIVSIVKDCCKKSEAASHSGNMHCPSDCNLFYVDIAVGIRHSQSVSWGSLHSPNKSDHKFSFLRPPIA